jgi:hypothetical protein
VLGVAVDLLVTVLEISSSVITQALMPAQVWLKTSQIVVTGQQYLSSGKA